MILYINRTNAKNLNLVGECKTLGSKTFVIALDNNSL